ncbi:MAG: ABC transporter ATP-binding protein [Flavobacteriales bacterium]
MAVLLHTEDLAVGYGRPAVLSQVALQVNTGELTAILGANGSGKSTLLRTLAGLLPPLAGRVLMGSEEVHRLPMQQRGRRLAIVLTGRPQVGLLNVEGLVGLGRHPWTGRTGRLSPEDASAVQRALEHAGVSELRHRQVQALSDGEYQKVMIARALAQDAPVLLLDEPTAFLDLPNRARLTRMLRRIAHGTARAVVFSTHDLQLAVDLCDRIVLVRPDRTLWQGPPAEAIASGELERAFAGTGLLFDRAQGTHRFLP